MDQNLARPGLVALCSHWLRQHKFARFVIIGGINTVVTYLIYVGLVVFLAYPVAYSVTWAVGIVLSYVLNAWFVFRRKLSLVVMLQYPLVYVVQYVVGMALLYVLVEWAHVSKFVAPVLVVFVSVPLTYVLSRRIIERRP